MEPVERARRLHRAVRPVDVDLLRRREQGHGRRPPRRVFVPLGLFGARLTAFGHRHERRRLGRSLRHGHAGGVRAALDTLYREGVEARTLGATSAPAARCSGTSPTAYCERSVLGMK